MATLVDIKRKRSREKPKTKTKAACGGRLSKTIYLQAILTKRKASRLIRGGNPEGTPERTART